MQAQIFVLPTKQRQADLNQPPRQLLLLPQKIKTTYPADDSHGTGYCGEVITELGKRYYIKAQESGQHVPFTELLGYELCRHLLIATPAYDLLQKSDGTIVFGSEKIYGAELGDTFRRRIIKDANIHYWAAIQFSRLLALDVFLSNPDRSFKNLLWQPNDSESARPSTSGSPPPGSMIVFDFDKAFTAVNWPLINPAFPSRSASQSIYKFAKESSLFEPKEIGKALDKLANLPAIYMDLVLSKAPIIWMTGKRREQIREWWDSPARGERIELSERYIKNELKVSVFHN